MEIEVKLKYKNRKKVVSWLKDNKFKLVDKREIRDSYFGLDNDSMSNQNSLYRIRNIVGELVELTLKDSCQDEGGVWTRREINVGIDKPEDMIEILLSLGCSLIKENFSTREIWKKGNIQFEFINFSKPARLELIEVEGPSKDAVSRVVEDLGKLVNVVGEEIFAVFDN